MIFPSGPLREPISSLMTHIIIINGDKNTLQNKIRDFK